MCIRDSPQADHTSGPTVVAERDIEADRKAWEDEQVPYDDAAIAAYEGDADVQMCIRDSPYPARVPARTGRARLRLR